MTLGKIVLALLVTTMLAGCETQSNADKTTYQLYFLGGQSNMDGYGYVNELPDDVAALVERVHIFTGLTALDDATGGGVGIWEPLQPGHGTGFETDGKTNQFSDRFGPELTFGQTLSYLQPEARIAIVKYSMGGTSLALGAGYGSWHPDYVDGEGINQYDHALAAIRNALSHADIDGDGIDDRLIPSGIVWMQGEADAFHSQAAADAYEASLERLMNLFRTALGTADLPVIIGKITDSGMDDDGLVMDYITTVQRAQQNFSNADSCASLVTITDDLDYSDDNWHYDTDGFVRLGAAFAEAMNELEADCGPHR